MPEDPTRPTINNPLFQGPSLAPSGGVVEFTSDDISRQLKDQAAGMRATMGQVLTANEGTVTSTPDVPESPTGLWVVETMSGDDAGRLFGPFTIATIGDATSKLQGQGIAYSIRELHSL